MTTEEEQAERQRRRRRIDRLKKMILGTIGALIIIPVCICIILGVGLHKANVRTRDDKQKIASLEQLVQELEGRIEAAESAAMQTEPSAPEQSAGNRRYRHKEDYNKTASAPWVQIHPWYRKWQISTSASG